MRRPILAALIALPLAFSALADIWSLPERATFESANGQWRVAITPKRLQSQLAYFRDKVDGAADAGAAEGVRNNRARAELFRRSGKRWKRIAAWNLVNEVAPVTAMVASDGTVITFNNWHSAGYGDDTIVIYRPDGELVRKLGLVDLMHPDDVDYLPRSTSSIHWDGEHRLEEDQRRLIVQVKAYHLVELPISIDTGELLVPKRALYGWRTVTWTAEDVRTERCRFGGFPVSGNELVARATVARVPAYPDLACRHRLTGRVLLDVYVDEQGVVEEAHILTPLPFGLAEAAREAVEQWRFRPLERDGQRSPMCGRVKISFERQF